MIDLDNPNLDPMLAEAHAVVRPNGLKVDEDAFEIGCRVAFGLVTNAAKLDRMRPIPDFERINAVIAEQETPMCFVPASNNLLYALICERISLTLHSNIFGGT